jgi:hypothetical protein
MAIPFDIPKGVDAKAWIQRFNGLAWGICDLVSSN